MSLTIYRLARRLLPLVAKRSLMARVAAGREHPKNWIEKMGVPSLPRPNGPLVWLHAVGLGEVLSLRGLIAALHDANPALQFLVTTSSLAAADAFAKQDLPRTQHQFLPLDAPHYVAVFLDHWSPQIVVWAEQDLWPGLICDVAKRNIPQVLVNARMNNTSAAKHRRLRGAFRKALNHMEFITAQDTQTAQNLTTLGAEQTIAITGGTKAGAPPLAHDPAFLDELQLIAKGRRIWLCISAYIEDVAIAVEAQAIVHQTDPSVLLIIAPRHIDLVLDMAIPRRSKGQAPDGPIWVCDTLGDLGVLYRAADIALIGGTFHAIEGHNPWEAIALGCGVLHGPRTANFASDFAALDDCGAAASVTNAKAIADAILGKTRHPNATNADSLLAVAKGDVAALADRILRLL